MYALRPELKQKPNDEQKKTIWPGVREIGPVSIYGDVYDGKDLRKRCVLSLQYKREGVIDGN